MFSRIDLKQAYFQISVQEDGRYNRLGIVSAPAISQRANEIRCRISARYFRCAAYFG